MGSTVLGMSHMFEWSPPSNTFQFTSLYVHFCFLGLRTMNMASFIGKPDKSPSFYLGIQLGQPRNGSI